MKQEKTRGHFGLLNALFLGDSNIIPLVNQPLRKPKNKTAAQLQAILQAATIRNFRKGRARYNCYRTSQANYYFVN